MEIFRTLSYVTILTTLLPLVVLIVRPTADANRRRVAALGVTWFTWEAINFTVVRSGILNNLWVAYFMGPLVALLVMLILYHWQVSPRGRSIIKVVAPVYLVAILTLTLSLERFTNFSLVNGPLTGLTLLVLTMYTLVGRSLREPEALSQYDWFWVCMGLALGFALDAFLQPSLRFLRVTSIPLLKGAFSVNVVVGLVANLLIARGMLCPERRSESTWAPPIPTQMSGA